MVLTNNVSHKHEDRYLVRQRLVIKFVALAVACFAINLALDSTYCILPPCLTKAGAYQSIRIGTSSEQAQGLLFRAGVSCPGEEGPSSHCTVFTFSDFWKDYSIEIDTSKRIVNEKRFGFRAHGKGFLEFLHILR